MTKNTTEKIPTTAPKILMISGELSGDLHGSALIKEILSTCPEVTIKGMGGKKMLAAGLSGFDSSSISVVGLVE
ncbi:MAG: lipid-A-disaccharide synthase, partial [Deltaproteobacteria bacterium]|nr:lipid-A-disaccharide synthase [Deltaproteobacteria bacterium]